MAGLVLNVINKELSQVNTEFNTPKDMAEYCYKFNHFPSLIMDKYRHGSVNNFKICHQINKVIKGEHPTLEINVTLKQNNI